MSNSSHYSLLIQKLDQFIRKYYINKAIRGAILFAAATIGVFLLYSFLEHQFYLSQGGRKVLFYSYIVGSIGSLIYLVVWPLASYFKLGSVISHDTAAKILGEHFTDVEDRLVNVLQLNRNISASNRELIEASINQKSEKISIVPFRKAIDLNKNRKYLKYAFPPLALLLFILFAAPSLIRDSTYRIINNNEDFEREAPFHLSLNNDDLEVLQYEDYTLTVTADGEQLPNEVYVTIDDYDYRLTKQANNTFSYKMTNVRKDTPFQLYSGRYRNREQVLKVLPKPRMVNFSLKIDYPSYTQQRDETVLNTGDITVPQGTNVEWLVNTLSTDDVMLRFDDAAPIALEQQGSATFAASKRIYKDHNYVMRLKNEHLPQGDSLNFYIKTIADKHPTIQVDMIQDSIEKDITYFVGDGADDYGLQSLNFVYTISNDAGATITQQQKPIVITPSTQINFDYILDIKDLGLEPGQKVTYYFELFDNDGVNGSKSVKSSILSYREKSLDELEEEEQENEELIKDKLDSSIDEAKDIQEELRKLREKLLQKTEPDWQDKKQLEQLLERQQNLQQQMEQAKNANEQNLQNQKSQENNPQLQEKQERLQQLFEEVVDDEMQSLMEEIQKLMEELGKEQTLEKMEDFEKKEESLENEMERLQELYEQLEVEKELQESIDKLEELAEDLDELSEKTEDESESQEELEKEQEEINEEFEELKEQMEELMEKNDELEFPKDVPQDAQEQMEDINEDLNESQESMEQQENQKAASKQKQASQKMKQMAGQMSSEMMQGASEQQQEDLETLRQLLENLVTLSFDQEGLVNSINITTINTPRYVSLLQDQMKVSDDFKVVEDTLQALSKRNPDLESFVLEKVTEIKYQLGSSLDQLEERNKPEANQSQRTTMTNLNDLALMLSESMEQMQQQMSGMMSGSQMCENPGQNPGKKPGKGNSGGVPMDKISEGQEKMTEDLKKMIEGMKGSNGEGGSAKDFAEAAAKQAALRKALEGLQQGLQESGQGGSNELQDIIDQMDKQEIDLVNKRLDNEMLLRQQDIVTRLLEAENAQKEREYDDQRKSTEGQDIERKLPPSLEEYIKHRKAQLEQYKYVSPEMKPHYKRLVEEYYQKLKRA